MLLQGCDPMTAPVSTAASAIRLTLLIVSPSACYATLCNTAQRLPGLWGYGKASVTVVGR